MRRHYKRKKGRLFALCLFFIVTNTSVGFTADEESCLICHKYPGLARIDQNTGHLRLFYVDDQKYGNSVHGKILWRNCHLNLDKIPHADFAKVNCSTKCHIKEPSSDKEFSHGTIYGELNASVHGIGTKENPKKFTEDMPSCTDCHLNTVLQPVTGVRNQEAGVSADALRGDGRNSFLRKPSGMDSALCRTCHSNKYRVEGTDHDLSITAPKEKNINGMTVVQARGIRAVSCSA